MAESGSTRTTRWRLHKLGDHSMCKACAAVREDQPVVISRRRQRRPVDPVGELNAAAARLIAVHEADPSNVAAAHELRLTLEALAHLAPMASDPMDELSGMLRDAS